MFVKQKHITFLFTTVGQNISPDMETHQQITDTFDCITTHHQE